MTLSIITINLNNKTGLQKTMASVFSQDYRDYEYIIIDGGSTDGSTELITGASGELSYWSSEKDEGIYHAMNKGLAVSKGDYIYFLNSGDTLSSSTILTETRRFFNRDVALIYGDIYLAGSKRAVRYPDKLNFSFLFGGVISHQAMFISRKVFETTGPFEASYKIIADWVLFVKAVTTHCFEYKHIPLVIAAYDEAGISSDPASWKQIREEREAFFSTYFSMHYEDQAELAAYRSNKRVQLLSSIEKDPIIRKIISPILRFFSFMARRGS